MHFTHQSASSNKGNQEFSSRIRDFLASHAIYYRGEKRHMNIVRGMASRKPTVGSKHGLRSIEVYGIRATRDYRLSSPRRPLFLRLRQHDRKACRWPRPGYSPLVQLATKTLAPSPSCSRITTCTVVSLTGTSGNEFVGHSHRRGGRNGIPPIGNTRRLIASRMIDYGTTTTKCSPAKNWATK